MKLNYACESLSGCINFEEFMQNIKKAGRFVSICFILDVNTHESSPDIHRIAHAI